MSNSILTSQIAVPFIAEVESSLPILANGNIQFNKNFVGGNGSTMDILLPSYGNTVGTGADITGDISDVVNAKKSVTLTQYHKALSLTQVEQSLELSSYEDQVAVPFGNKLASDIQKIAVDTLKLGASNVTVVTTGAGAGSYTDISKGIAAISAARGNGERFGVMSPDLATAVMNSGLNFFQADIKESFVNGKLGTFRNVKFFETQDVGGVFTAGTYSATAVVPSANATAGATTLAIAGSTLTGTIKKGAGFTVAGCYSVDMYGNSTGKLYTFIAQSDVTASGNAATVAINAIYASGPLKNISKLPTTADAITFIHTSGKSYTSALIWDKQAFITASAKLQKLSQVESKSVNGKVMNLMVSKGTDVVKGIDVVRFDTLCGFALAYPNLVSRIDVLID